MKHVVHFNTVDNKPFLQRSNMIPAWRRGNSTNLELGLASNPDTAQLPLGTFRFWKLQSLGCAFSRTTWEIPSCASKRHLHWCQEQPWCHAGGTVSLTALFQKAFLPASSLPQRRQDGSWDSHTPGRRAKLLAFSFPGGCPLHDWHGHTDTLQTRAGICRWTAGWALYRRGPLCSTN